MNQEPSVEKAASPETEKFFTTPLIIIFITVFIDLIGFGIVLPILPIYAETDPFNATPFEVGMLFAIYSWMQFFFTPILGKLSDRYGRRPILFISLLGSALGWRLSMQMCDQTAHSGMCSTPGWSSFAISTMPS